MLLGEFRLGNTLDHARHDAAGAAIAGADLPRNGAVSIFCLFKILFGAQNDI